QRREVAAWIAQAAEDHESAIAGMRSAAELEESMDKDPITPGAITPAREMLAELLAMNHRPREALAEYEAVLRIAPKRFNAVYGAAAAAEAAGDAMKAAGYYRSLAAIAKSDERPEVAAARKKLEMARN